MASPWSCSTRQRTGCHCAVDPNPFLPTHRLADPRFRTRPSSTHFRVDSVITAQKPGLYPHPAYPAATPTGAMAGGVEPAAMSHAYPSYQFAAPSHSTHPGVPAIETAASNANTHQSQLPDHRHIRFYARSYVIPGNNVAAPHGHQQQPAHPSPPAGSTQINIHGCLTRTKRWRRNVWSVNAGPELAALSGLQASIPQSLCDGRPEDPAGLVQPPSPTIHPDPSQPVYQHPSL